MTPEEAKRNQDEISQHWNLSNWYGTRCEKCCGVYPKYVASYSGGSRYECEVCGKTTEPYSMPWLAEQAWNEGWFVSTQGRLF